MMSPNVSEGLIICAQDRICFSTKAWRSYIGLAGCHVNAPVALKCSIFFLEAWARRLVHTSAAWFRAADEVLRVLRVHIRESNS